jgi:hypothetical protein
MPNSKYFHNGTKLSIKYPGLGWCEGVIKKRKNGSHGIFYQVEWEASLGNKEQALYIYPCDDPKTVMAMAAVEQKGGTVCSSWQPFSGKILRDPRYQFAGEIPT